MSDPNSQAQVAPVRASASFDLARLRELHQLHADYGKALTKQLFADNQTVERFIQVETAAQATRSFLRVVIGVDVSAQELQSLRWELLCHPRTGATLSTSESVLLSRFVVSRDWQPVKLRADATKDLLDVTLVLGLGLGEDQLAQADPVVTRRRTARRRTRVGLILVGVVASLVGADEAISN